MYVLLELLYFRELESDKYTHTEGEEEAVRWRGRRKGKREGKKGRVAEKQKEAEKYGKGLLLAPAQQWQ